MSDQKKLLLIAALAVVLAGIFLFLQIDGQWAYAFPRRLKKAAAVGLAGFAVAYSSLLFQTITNNRILTPSIIGFDALYLLIQGATIFLFGANSAVIMDHSGYFLLNVVLMILLAGVLYRFLFRREDRHIYFILLAGLICGTLFRSIFSFLLVLIDPNEFHLIQDKMFASFNQVNTDLLLLAACGVTAVSLYSLRFLAVLDVLSLGRDHAHNLGVDCERTVGRLLVVVAVLVAVSTALVGPVTFLGLLVVNVVYSLFQTYRHRVLIPGTVLISLIALFGGLLLVERVFSFATNLTVIINGVGGSYFLYLMLREGKKC